MEHQEFIYGVGIVTAFIVGFVLSQMLTPTICWSMKYSWLCSIAWYFITIVGTVLIFFLITRPKIRET